MLPSSRNVYRWLILVPLVWSLCAAAGPVSDSTKIDAVKK